MSPRGKGSHILGHSSSEVGIWLLLGAWDARGGSECFFGSPKLTGRGCRMGNFPFWRSCRFSANSSTVPTNRICLWVCTSKVSLGSQISLRKATAWEFWLLTTFLCNVSFFPFFLSSLSLSNCRLPARPAQLTWPARGAPAALPLSSLPSPQ